MRKLLVLLILQLGFMSPAYSYTVSGYIFEDYNFGGEKRSFDPDLGMAAMSLKDIQVQLSNGRTTYTVNTDNGEFEFKRIPNGTYTLSLPRDLGNDLDGDIYSIRGNCEPCMPIQVWPEITEQHTRQVIVSNQNLSGVNLGFNYSSVINSSNDGVGSLRQFVTNSSKLTGDQNWAISKSELEQEAHLSGYDNAIFAISENDLVIDLDSRIEIDSIRDTRIDATHRSKSITVNSADDTYANWSDAGQVFEFKYSHHVSIVGLNIISQGSNNQDYANTIDIEQSSNISVLNNLIRGSFDDSIEVTRSNNIEIRTNTLSDIKGEAVKVESSDDVDINENSFIDIDGDAVRLFWSNSNEVNNNNFTDIYQHGVYLYSTDQHVISGNQFSSIGKNAIRAEHSGDNNISNNNIDNAYRYGMDTSRASAIYLGDVNSHDSDVVGNTIINTAKGNSFNFGNYLPSAVRVQHGDRNYIVENYFQGNVGLNIDIVSGNAYGIKNSNDGQYSSNIPNDGIDQPVITSVEEQSDKLIVKGYTGLANKTIDAQRINIYSVVTDSLGKIDSASSLGVCRTNENGEYWRNYEFECHLENIDLSSISELAAIAIRHFNPSSSSEFSDAFPWNDSRDFDYGDAPNEDLGTGWGVTTFPVLKEDDGARHAVVDGIALVPESATSTLFHNSPEDNGQPSRYADADDSDDGVSFNPNNDEVNESLFPVLMTGYIDSSGHESSLDNEIVVRASAAGYVSVWLDKNQDGSWNGFERNKQFISEKVLDRVAVDQGANSLTVNLSPYDVHGESWVRVRYSTDSNSIEHVTGASPDGEVEDYRVWIAAPSMATAGCEAGLQNGSFEKFFTEDGHNGWDTPESSVAGWSIVQQNVALNPHSQPYGQRRNHIEFNDYYHYVHSKASDDSQNVAEMNVYHPTIMYQDVVTKPGDKIRWSFDYSNRTKNNNKEDQISLLFGSPSSALVEDQVIDGEDGWVTHTGSYQVLPGQYVTRIAFKGNKPVGGSAGNILDNAHFGCEVGLDFGDLPGSYDSDLRNESRKVLANLYIGPSVADTETEHQASDSAKGDDADGFNDELTFNMPLTIVRGSSTVSITIPSVTNNTGGNATLKGYLDIKPDTFVKRFKDSDGEYTSELVGQGTQSLTLTWDLGSTAWTSDSQTYLRLVLEDNNGNGEIEDHLVTITDSPLVPKPGRCDGFVQTKKDKGNNKKFEYLKWVPEDGEVTLSSISNPLAISRINSIGVNQVDGYTYGLGLIDSTGDQYIVFADQTPNVQFYPLHKIVASEDLELRAKDNRVYQFSKGESLNANKTAVGTNDKLSSSTAGDVSPDGTQMVLGKGSWQSLVIVDLATGEFSTVHVSGNTMGADLAFHPAGNGDAIYTLSGNLQTLYKTSTLDGTYQQYSLKLLVGDGSIANPKWPETKGDSKLTPGGFGISQGGTLFVMTNGGIHDLDQNGSLDSVEGNNPTTALYTIELNQVVDGNKRPIRFIQQGEAKSLQANDAGGCVIHADYGDVPVALETDPFSSFSPARHIGSNESLKLGALWSADLGPGDDSVAASDPSDDGVTFKDANDNVIDVATALFIPGRAYSIELDEKGSGSSRLWVSFDGAKWNLVSNGTILIPDTGIEKGYLRVRYASNAADIMSPYGEASDGEVEDYALNIGNALKGMTVAAPTNPLTCEVAQYTVTLAADGDELSQDVNVQVSFENAPDQCWFDAASFTRTDLSSRASCKTDTRDILFEAGGDLSRTIYVATDFENTAIKLVAQESDIGEASDATTFAKEGFRITTTPVSSGGGDLRGAYYIAGRDFDLKVERKVALSDTNCTVDPDYQGTQTFEFSYDKGSEAYKGALSLGGKSIASDTLVDLNFTSGVSDTVKANYRESGHLDISAKYTPVGGDEKQAGLATALHVKPYALVVNKVHQADDASKLDDGNPNTYFVPSETEFTAEVLAVAQGHTSNASRVTKNFNASLFDSDGFTAVVETPAAKNGDSASELKKQSGSTQFSEGIYSGTYWYQNVGAVAMNWTVDSYGVGGLSSFLNTDDSVNNGGRNNIIGHFYPDAFKVTSSEFSTGVTKATDSSQEWTYFGQPNVDLSVSLEAVGINGTQLSFYDSAYWAVTPFTTVDDLVFLSSNVCADRRFANGIVIFDGTSTVCDFGSTWNGGELNISLSDTRFVRNNSESTRLELNDIQGSLIDQEFDYVVGGVDEHFEGVFEFGELIDVRYGRLAMQSVAGPIEQLLPMRIQTEYWNGNGFEVNDWHSQSSSDLGTLSGIADLVPLPKEVGGGVPVISPDPLPLSNLVLGEMGTSIQGSLAGSVDVPFIFDSGNGIQNWLGYCWRVDGSVTDCAVSDSNNYLQPPSAIATFGATTSSDNIIYIMERFE